MRRDSGWIKLHRKIRDNFLWEKKRPLSFLEAWIDILLEVQHDENPQSVLIGATTLRCHRGESLKSLRTWANRFRWSVNRVRRFFKLLEKEEMIERKTDTGTTRITVCNYEKYNAKRNSDGYANGTVADTRTEHERHTDNNDKNDKNKQIVDADAPTVSIISNPIEEFIKAFGEAYQKRMGVEYLVVKGKDHKLVKDLIQHYGPDKLTEYINPFFALPANDHVLAENGYTIGTLKSRIPKLTIKPKYVPSTHDCLAEHEKWVIDKAESDKKWAKDEAAFAALPEAERQKWFDEAIQKNKIIADHPKMLRTAAISLWKGEQL